MRNPLPSKDSGGSAIHRVIVVDDDSDIRTTVRLLLEGSGYAVKEFQSAATCLEDRICDGDCLLSDIRMPGLNGMEFLEELGARGIAIPVVFMTGYADVELAVQAMKAGAVDFIQKPFKAAALLESIEKALIIGFRVKRTIAEANAARQRIALLTPREKQVLELLVAGQSHKLAARALGISYRTVEVHRAHIMEKLGATGLSDLVRIDLAASNQPAADRTGKSPARNNAQHTAPV